MKEKKKKDYEVPLIRLLQVETEGGFCASITPDDQQEEPTISIQEQEVGVESNYFDNTDGDKNKWDF